MCTNVIHAFFKYLSIRRMIDNMQYNKAVQLCDKVFEKQTDSQAGKALKALALSRQQRVEEVTALINQLVLEKPVDEGTLQAMTMYFREAGQLEKVPVIYDAAVKKKPKNDELLCHLFMAYVRTEDYKKQQHTVLALHNIGNPYYWTVMSIIIQGGLAVAVAMDLECDMHNQIEAIVSDSLLPQEYEMEHNMIPRW